ncbi:MAG: HAD family hydrolase [Acidimicrobiales bacterium]
MTPTPTPTPSTPHPTGQRVAVLFDIDGTLIISGGAGAESWRLAFNELYGVPADIGAFTDTGMTDPEVGRLTFKGAVGRDPTDDEFAKLLDRRLHYLRRAVMESKDYQVLDGVEDTIHQLLDRGYVLGIVTGNVEPAAHVKLHRANLNRFFCFGGYGSDSEDRGELTRCALRRASLVYGAELGPKRCVIIGDTPHDAEAAHAAGVACVGVASHNFNEDQLRKGGADWVIPSLAHGFPEDALA